MMNLQTTDCQLIAYSNLLLYHSVTSKIRFQILKKAQLSLESWAFLMPFPQKQKPEYALRFGFSTHLKSKMYEKTNY